MVDFLIGICAIALVIFLAWIFFASHTAELDSEIYEDEEEDEERRLAFERWQNAERVYLTEPKNKHIEFYINHIGKELEIVYYDKERTIIPTAVFAKKGYRGIYIDASADGEIKTFNTHKIDLVQEKEMR